MMMPKKTSRRVQADIVNNKIKADGSMAGANNGSIARRPPPADRWAFYGGMFDVPKGCHRRSCRDGGGDGDSYYGSVAMRSTDSAAGRSVLTLGSSVFANKRWGGRRRDGDVDGGDFVAMAGGSMVTPGATLGTGIGSSYLRSSRDTGIRRKIVVALLIAAMFSLFLQGSVPSTRMPDNVYTNSHQRKAGGGYGRGNGDVDEDGREDGGDEKYDLMVGDEEGNRLHQDTRAESESKVAKDGSILGYGELHQATEAVRERERTNGDSNHGNGKLHQMTETEREINRTNDGSILGYGGFKHRVESENDEDYDAAVDIAFSSTDDHRHWKKSMNTQSYTLEDALYESSIFDSTFALIVYNPPTDTFLGMYNKHHKWVAGNKKLWKSMRCLTFMLRKVFPERFNSNMPELVLAIGSGDHPQVDKWKLPHSDGVAPVLMFGSSFRDTNVYKNMVAMPMPSPGLHLDCFVQWAQSDGKQLCEGLRLVFGEENELQWDSLIPQLIWRGTDFHYLTSLLPHDALIRFPDPQGFIRDVGDDDEEEQRRVDAILALSAMRDNLVPRWKGVALTAESELQFDRSGNGNDNALPWLNIKFSSFLMEGGKGKAPTVGSSEYSAYESVGIAVGEGKSLADLAHYKYQIDLAGGGGTTWTGTIEKLQMPGLLFHHVTPTKDYFHDRLIPWKHYIPVSADLSDLKSKYDWSKRNPDKAKRVANAGTRFIREIGTAEGFARMFEEDFKEPLRRVIEAYVPVSRTHPAHPDTSWTNVLQLMGDDCPVLPVVESSGYYLTQMQYLQVIYDHKGRWRPSNDFGLSGSVTKT